MIVTHSVHLASDRGTPLRTGEASSYTDASVLPPGKKTPDVVDMPVCT